MFNYIKYDESEENNMSSVVDAIVGIGFVIVWLPLTVAIYSAISKRVTTISFNGEMGLFSAALNRAILSGILAAMPIVIIGQLIVDHWKILVGIIMVGYAIYSYASKDKGDVVEDTSEYANISKEEGQENEVQEIEKTENYETIKNVKSFTDAKQSISQYCSSCGTMLEEDAKFCSKCGQPTNVMSGEEDS